MYDQHPNFVAHMQYILQELNKQEEKEAREQEAKAEREQRSARAKRR